MTPEQAVEMLDLLKNLRALFLALLLVQAVNLFSK